MKNDITNLSIRVHCGPQRQNFRNLKIRFSLNIYLKKFSIIFSYFFIFIILYFSETSAYSSQKYPITITLIENKFFFENKVFSFNPKLTTTILRFDKNPFMKKKLLKAKSKTNSKVQFLNFDQQKLLNGI